MPLQTDSLCWSASPKQSIATAATAFSPHEEPCPHLLVLLAPQKSHRSSAGPAALIFQQLAGTGRLLSQEVVHRSDASGLSTKRALEASSQHRPSRVGMMSLSTLPLGPCTSTVSVCTWTPPVSRCSSLTSLAPDNLTRASTQAKLSCPCT